MRDMTMRNAALLLPVLSAITLEVVASDRVRKEIQTPAVVREKTGLPVRQEGVRVDGELPPGVTASDGFTEQEAAATALWNNAQLSADLAAVGIARANWVDAGTLRNMQFQILLPVGPKPFELWAYMPWEQFLQRRRRLNAAEAQWDQVAESLAQNALNTWRDARQAQAALAQAERRLSLAREALQIRSEVARLTAARERSGDISRLEVRQSESDRGTAAEQVRRFEHDLELARIRLRVVMGLSPNMDVRPQPEEMQLPVLEPLAPLRERALSQRPDLRAMEVAIQAAAMRARWERSRLLVLGGLLSIKEFLGRGTYGGPGVQFELPIFKTNKGTVSRAEAEVEQAARQYLAMRQRVDQEVSEAYQGLRQSLDSYNDWTQHVLPPLDAAVAEAEKALASGDISRLNVFEARRGAADARLRLADLELAIKRAKAELDRSIGGMEQRGIPPQGASK